MPRTQIKRKTHYPAIPPDPVLSGVLRDDIVDQMDGIKDVYQAFELLGTLVDPLVKPGTVVVDLDREQMSAMLRLLASAFANRLAAVDGLLAEGRT